MFVKKYFKKISIFTFFTLLSLLLYCYWNGTEEYYTRKLPSSNAVLPIVTKERVGRVLLPLRKAPEHRELKSLTFGSTVLSNDTKGSVDYISLREVIEKTNAKQAILNEDKFGPLKRTDHIFVIQVHNRTDYFKLLIDSLRNVRGINETLLIFSHDIFNNEINEIVQSIEFAKVMQIFYPNSSQLYPNAFPGDDPNDCPPDIKTEEAIRIKCNNALHPDSFGHYRQSKSAQIKHHWFWKINFVFDYLRVTQNYKGFLTLIEDDYFVFPDTIYVLDFIRNETFNRQITGLISLGDRNRKEDFSSDSGLIKLIADIHSHSITINKQFWNRLKTRAKQFCKRDDYNWDASLSYIAKQCMKHTPSTLEVAASRIHHIGDCGFHFNKQNCNETYKNVLGLLNKAKDHLFPEKFTVFEDKSYFSTVGMGPWGGFGDPRDHSLCLSFVKV